MYSCICMKRVENPTTLFLLVYNANIIQICTQHLMWTEWWANGIDISQVLLKLKIEVTSWHFFRFFLWFLIFRFSTSFLALLFILPFITIVCNLILYFIWDSSFSVYVYYWHSLASHFRIRIKNNRIEQICIYKKRVTMTRKKRCRQCQACLVHKLYR